MVYVLNNATVIDITFRYGSLVSAWPSDAAQNRYQQRLLLTGVRGSRLRTDGHTALIRVVRHRSTRHFWYVYVTETLMVSQKAAASGAGQSINTK